MNNNNLWFMFCLSTSTVGGGEGQQLQTPHDHGLVQAAISGELTTLHHEKHHVGNCNIQFYGCGKRTTLTSSLVVL